MTETEEQPTKVSEQRPFVITRVFDAPRELVWKAWTEREHMKWWGPKGVTIHHAQLELRPGGTFHYCMRTADGHDMWGKWVIREVVEPERLVFVNSFSDEKGGLTRHPMSTTWPLEMLSTVVFSEPSAGKTAVTLKWLPLHATGQERETFDAAHEGMTAGWTGSFERLDEYLVRVQDPKQPWKS